MSDSVNAIRRRILLAGTSGAALSIYPALIPSAFGKAPMAGSQAISVHRMKLGNFEITAMLDGFIDIPPGVLQADPELVKTLLTAGGWPPAPMRLPVNTFLVNTGEKLVLLDAGGAKMLGPTAGRLPQCLAAAGIEPGQIDEVYITHMHGDHLHGTVTPEGTAMFPNATLRIAKADMDYWTSPEVEAKAPENQKPVSSRPSVRLPPMVRASGRLAWVRNSPLEFARLTPRATRPVTVVSWCSPVRRACWPLATPFTSRRCSFRARKSPWHFTGTRPRRAPRGCRFLTPR